MLNRIWELDRVFTNLLLTQQELVGRERVGSKLIKRQAAAATPLERVVRSGVLSSHQRGVLTRVRNFLRPGEPQREIARLCAQLERLAIRKAAVPQRAVNRSFNTSTRPELLASIHRPTPVR